jgi:hypothetical protein
MTRVAIKTILIFAAAYVGFPMFANSCPKQRAQTTEKRDAEIPRFAIAGLVDVDKDGESDLELIRQLIQRNGGAIDAEFRIDGTLRGELRRDTGYIILGELPDEAKGSPTVVEQFDAFVRRAAELKLRVLYADALLQDGSRRTARETDAGSPFRPRRPLPERHGAY